MSNFLLKDPDCVLIHIPKTAGTSIRKGVWRSNYIGPVFGRIPDEWMSYFKFAFVRHPFDRFISAWKMFTDGAVGDRQWSMPDDAFYMDIDEFFDVVSDERIIFDERRRTFKEKIRHHTIPQTHPFNCLRSADFIGRYEHIEADFDHVATMLGISEKLPRMHYTCHGHWRDLMSRELIDKCGEYYKEDFDALGYKVKS